MSFTLALMYGIPVVAAVTVFAALSLVGLIDLEAARNLQLYRDYATVEVERAPARDDNQAGWNV